MSRFPRLRRRPDHWRDAHERARIRAAERLDGPLGLAETQWLDEHLAGCPACAAVAASYVADRESLRTLRDQTPEPPRDLWARTAAAIEQLSPEPGGEAAAPDEPVADPGVRRLRALPLGAMSAVAVVVVVVGASLLTRGITAPTPQVASSAEPSARIATASGSPAPIFPGAEPTPFAVLAGPVNWVDAGPGGVAYSTATVDEVCPQEGSSNCSPVAGQDTQRLILSSTPKTVIGSPKSKQAVAISKAATAGDQIVVVELPDDPPMVPSPSPTRSAAPSATPTTEASPTDGTTEGPATPTPTVEITTSPSPTPTETPQASATAIAIASGIEVVGESAAFSADGAWFAFTARPKDGSGPDVYIWRVGDGAAKRLTTDGTSYFGSWSGDRAVVSRPLDPTARTTDPVSVVIDPVTGDSQPVGALWRPMVDPAGTFAIGWDGTLDRVDSPVGWVPSHGKLTLRTWTNGRDGGTPKGSNEHTVAANQARNDYDVRWDETGEWVAIWVGNDGDATVGQLTLYHLDGGAQRLEHVKGAPEDVQAQSGFSNGAGRLAWVTPRGQGGEGSRVQIAAWSDTGVGIAAGSPGEDPVVIR